MDGLLLHLLRPREFQCSSASRKFLNFAPLPDVIEGAAGFSALQRAENSSMRSLWRVQRRSPACFSALQRAENSSIRG